MADNTIPGWFRVCLNTIVRAKEELDSERLRILPMGSKVYVEEQKGRRVRITQPLAGWCSVSSSSGDTILTPHDGPQNATTPSDAARLEKMRQQMQKGGKDSSDLERQMKSLEQQLQIRTAQVKDLQQRVQEIKTNAFRPGDVVKLAHNREVGLGIVRYVGGRKGVDGVVIGIEFDTQVGDSSGKIIKPNGEEGGFDAPEGYATFEPVSTGNVILIDPEKLFVQLVYAMEQETLSKKDDLVG